MSFGERLKLARERKGMTQQQIADLMNIDKSTYCGYETGKRQPDVQKIKVLSGILGVSGDELLETGYAVESSDLDRQLEGVDFALYGEVKDLSDAQKRDVLRFVQFLKDKEKRG